MDNHTTMHSSKLRTSLIWKYYKNHDHIKKRAFCDYCKRPFSYRSTITNLKRHLQHKHAFLYEELTQRESALYLKKAGETEIDLSEFSEHYEPLTSGEARCKTCGKSVLKLREHLRRHVETSHPEIFRLASEESNDDNVDSDSDVSNNPQNTFTEVIYLEEEDNKPEEKKPVKIPIKRKQSESVPQAPKSVQRAPESVPQAPVQTETELDIFIKYISCLMKQLPYDVCSQVQLDIVNLIMTAKMKSHSAKNIVKLIPAQMNYVLKMNQDELGPSADENKK